MGHRNSVSRRAERYTVASNCGKRCRIGETAMVFVDVTMFDKTLGCQLPVLDHVVKRAVSMLLYHVVR